MLVTVVFFSFMCCTIEFQQPPYKYYHSYSVAVDAAVQNTCDLVKANRRLF